MPTYNPIMSEPNHTNDYREGGEEVVDYDETNDPQYESKPESDQDRQDNQDGEGRKDEGKDQTNVLFVSRFRRDTTVRDIEDLMHPFGPTTAVTIRDNIAFVDFVSAEDAAKAKEACHYHPGLGSDSLIVDFKKDRGAPRSLRAPRGRGYDTRGRPPYGAPPPRDRSRSRERRPSLGGPPPFDDRRGDPRDTSRDRAPPGYYPPSIPQSYPRRGDSRDRAPPRDIPRDLPRDFPRDIPRDIPRNIPRDLPVARGSYDDRAPPLDRRPGYANPPPLDTAYGRGDPIRPPPRDPYRDPVPPRYDSRGPVAPPVARGYNDRDYPREPYRPRDRDDPRAIPLHSSRPGYDDYRGHPPASVPPRGDGYYRAGGYSGNDRPHWNPPDSAPRYGSVNPPDDYYEEDRYAKKPKY